MGGIRYVSESRKIRDHRGEGTGADYKPWIYVREVNSKGTSSEPVDWKNGRTVQLLSQGEKAMWYYLMWDDSVVNIYEQYPLNLETTNKIATEAGIEPEMHGRQHMTSDLFAEYTDGHFEVFSVKNSRADIKEQRMQELLYVEMQYWELQGIAWHLVFKEDLNATFTKNLELVTAYYDPANVYDTISYTKYLIAHKIIKTDLKTQIINPARIYRDNQKEIDKYYEEDIRCALVTVSGDAVS